MTVVELFAKLGLKVDDASFKKGESAVGGIRTMLVGVGLTLTGVRAAIEAVVASTAAHGNAAQKAAQRVGVSVQAMQELTEAADDVQIGAGSVESAMKFVGKNAYEAAHGNKAAAEGFRALGVSTKDASGKLKTADVLMMELADGFAGVADADKPALAMKLFGKAGGDMIPLLNKGSAGIAEMRAEAVALGLVMDKEGVADSVAYTEALDGLQDSLKGLKLSIGGSLLKGSTEFLNTLAGWVRENRALIATKVKAFVDGFSVALKKLRQFLDPLIAAVKWLVAQTWLWKTAIAALAVALAIQLGAAVRSAVMGVAALAAQVIALTGAQVAAGAAAMGMALLWVAGIVLILLALEDLYTMFEGGDSVGTAWAAWLDKVLAKDPSDSPLLKGLKAIARALFDIQGAAEAIDRWFHESSDNGFASILKGLNAGIEGDRSAAGYHFGQAFLTPQGQEAAGVATMPGRSAAGFPAMPQGGGVKVQIGDVHVGASLPEGLSPGEFVRRLGAEVVTQSDLNNMFGAAYEAGAR